jgi:multicomponent Na+:H+ antiporter subunit B
MSTTLVNSALLLMMAATVVAIARTRNLFSVVILGSLYSFMMATILLVLDAVDVSMTEAAVGAGISTVLLLATLFLTQSEEAKPLHTPVLPVAVALVTMGLLAYGTLGLPHFGSPDSVIHQHVAPRYLESGPTETGVPNIVTAVLASYRGFDTLGEVAVIFTGGVGVIVLLRRRWRSERDEADEE